jgi:DNA-binding response OmpR family regulator
MNQKFNVVLIDDEIDFLASYKSQLEEEFHVHPFTSPRAALNFIESFNVDAVVMDYHMPGSNAHDTYMELRMRNFDQPVMFLTGSSDVLVKLNCLELGVDDYLQKPISISELTAYLRNRIRAYRRRNPGYVTIKNLRMKLDDPHVFIDNELIFLSPKECELLVMLVKNQNNVVHKEDILKTIWADVKVAENNVDTHMSNLRKKLKGFSGEIKTVKCVGYVLRV